MNFGGPPWPGGPPLPLSNTGVRDPANRDPNKDMSSCDQCYAANRNCEGPLVFPCSNCKGKGVDCLYAGKVPADPKYVATRSTQKSPNQGHVPWTPDYVKWLEEKVLSLVESGQVEIDVDEDIVPVCRPPPAGDASLRHPTPTVSRHFARHTESTPQQKGAPQTVPSISGGSPGNAILSTGVRENPPQTALFSQCRPFAHNFFNTVHYIYPILDTRADFMKRCESLWSPGAPAQKSSFGALYCSVVSLGALIGPREEEPIDGKDNSTWAGALFSAARSLCDRLGMTADLEMVQCYFFMALVCQHAMKPHMAYMYVGLAVRTALAICINQVHPRTRSQDPNITKAETRTWWALYALETEMSVSMRRPSGLGQDYFHNRPYPAADISRLTPDSVRFLDQPQCTIIEAMVSYSRLVRRICLEVYLQVGKTTPVSNPTATTTLNLALRTAANIELEIDKWIQGLPVALRPERGASQGTPLKAVKQAPHVKVQKLILVIKDHNIRMLLFASFVFRSYAPHEVNYGATQCFQNCVTSAKATIGVTYEAYKHNDFFRTWFYNTTYIVFAASVILTCLRQRARPAEVPQLREHVRLAIEILEFMDESATAIKSAQMLKKALQHETPKSGPLPKLRIEDGLWPPVHLYWGAVNVMDGEVVPNYFM